MAQYTLLTKLSSDTDGQIITVIEYVCRVYRGTREREEYGHFLIIKMRGRAAVEEVRGE